MTNADIIRNMSDEELFKFLTQELNVISTCCICDYGGCGPGDNYDCQEGVMSWLASEVVVLERRK